MQIASFPDVGSTVWGKQNRSVLVIYRDPTARSILKQLLEREGFGVTLAETGDRVLAALEETTFGAIVLDYDGPSVPQGRRIALMLMLRQRCPETPVIMTGTGGPAARLAALRQGATCYLETPFREAALLETLRRLTATAGASAAPEPMVAEPSDASVAPGLRGAVWRVILSRTRPSALSTPHTEGGVLPGSARAPRRVHSGLREVVARVGLSVDPARVIVVGFRRDAALLTTALHGSGARMLLQPRDRGTGAEVLLATYRIHACDPDATVAVVPSAEPFVESPAFAKHLEHVIDLVARHPRWVVVFGTRTTGLPGRRRRIIPGDVLDYVDAGPVWKVRRLVREPRGTSRAADSVRGFFSTCAFVARTSTLVESARAYLPGVHRRLLDASVLRDSDAGELTLRRAYGVVPHIDVIRALVEPWMPHVAVSIVSAGSESS